jgi:hypothetical protein
MFCPQWQGHQRRGAGPSAMQECPVLPLWWSAPALPVQRCRVEQERAEGHCTASSGSGSVWCHCNTGSSGRRQGLGSRQ